jgi:hypothetical protein
MNRENSNQIRRRRRNENNVGDFDDNIDEDGERNSHTDALLNFYRNSNFGRDVNLFAERGTG